MSFLQMGCLSDHKRCPQGLKPVLHRIVNVRAEARTLQRAGSRADSKGRTLQTTASPPPYTSPDTPAQYTQPEAESTDCHPAVRSHAPPNPKSCSPQKSG